MFVEGSFVGERGSEAGEEREAEAGRCTAAGGMPEGRPGWVLPLHMTAITLVQATSFALTFLIPVLARKQFGANDWQTLVLTASPTVFFSLSIFWNDLYNRQRFGRYLMIYWLVASAPLMLMAFAQGYWGLVIPYLVSCIGGAGYHPAAGDLLKSLYPDKVRGRMYSILWGTSMVVSAVLGFVVGKWMTVDAEAFRLYMPAGVMLQLVGMGLIAFIAKRTGLAERRDAAAHEAGLSDRRSLWQRVVEPITHAKEVLKEDPIFARYEAAYMTYGVGWMIAYALLPILVTTKLNLNYDEVAKSTHVAYLVAMVLVLAPAGWLMDRIGAIRSTGLSFGLLTFYPLALIFAGDDHALLYASVFYGVAHAGASVGWMLGPVALAPNPGKVAQYVAIHATLVGIRGKLFQGLGVALYWLMHSVLKLPLFWCFAVPLGLAAGAYLWSAAQMWTLDGRMKRKQAGAAAV